MVLILLLIHLKNPLLQKIKDERLILLDPAGHRVVIMLSFQLMI